MAKRVFICSICSLILLCSLYFLYPIINKVVYYHQIQKLYDYIIDGDIDKLSELFDYTVSNEELEAFISFARDKENLISSEIEFTRKWADFHKGSFIGETSGPPKQIMLLSTSTTRPFFILKGNILEGYSFEFRDEYIKIDVPNQETYDYYINDKKIDKKDINTESGKLVLGPFIPGEYNLKVIYNAEIIYNSKNDKSTYNGQLKLDSDYPFVLEEIRILNQSY